MKRQPIPGLKIPLHVWTWPVVGVIWAVVGGVWATVGTEMVEEGLQCLPDGEGLSVGPTSPIVCAMWTHRLKGYGFAMPGNTIAQHQARI